MASTAQTTALPVAKITANNDDCYVNDIVHLNVEIDPIVKIELDTLNQSAMRINRLETELDEARANYQSTFTEFSRQLELLKKKAGGSIKRARPFYELKEVARKKQAEAIRSARKFQTSYSVYLTSKETISLAELRLKNDNTACMSTPCQQIVNHSLLQETEAEKDKSISEREHMKCAAAFADAENKLHALEKKFKRSIAKARSYFETKKQLEVKLQQLKQSVEDIQQAILAAKQQYSDAMKCLEKVSDNMHKKRCQKVFRMFSRESGVGAEDSIATSEIEEKFLTLSTSDDIYLPDMYGTCEENYD